MHVLTLIQTRANLKQVMDYVCRDHMPVLITREGGESVVMVSLADYNGMQETLYLLSSTTNAQRLRSSLEEVRAARSQSRD